MRKKAVPRSDQELDRMHQANAITVETLEMLSERVEPGITTGELDRLAAENLKRHGVRSAFKGYEGFPATLCTSVNDEVVHGIPSRRRRLLEGDIVGLDFGCVVDGYFGDNATTVAVGEVRPKAKKLLEVAEASLFAGIDAARVGGRIGGIGHAVQTYVETHGFSVVREYGGHGIGTSLHAAPFVPNYGSPGDGERLVPGLAIAIEPMVNTGARDIRILRDRWTVVTADGGMSAHFERSIAVTEDGPWILCEPRSAAGRRFGNDA